MTFLGGLLLALFPANLFRAQGLPTCGLQAYNEAFHNHASRGRLDLDLLCNDADALHRFFWSLSTFCMWAPERKRHMTISALSDYEIVLEVLEAACPNLELRTVDLEKRQASGATTKAAATTATTAQTPQAQTSAAQTSAAQTSAAQTSKAQTSTAQTSKTQTSTAQDSEALQNASETITPATTTSQPSKVSATASVKTSSQSTSATSKAGTNSANLLGATVSATQSGQSAAASSSGDNSPQSSATPTNSAEHAPAIKSSSKAPPVSIVPSVTVPNTPLVAQLPQSQYAVSSMATPNPTVSLPTQSYTGQAVLVGTCTIPQYTAIPLSDGSYIAAPIVGCDDNHPECCPSLTRGSTAPTVTPFLGTFTNAAIITALAASPISICPADYTSTMAACCPVGFSMYGQAILGQTPCYSVLPQTITVPEAVSQQIQSLSSMIAATATQPNPTVSVHVIVDQVFSLSLPLKAGVETYPGHNNGLSTGAKIGIGVGAGFGALFAVSLCIWIAWFSRKRFRERNPRQPDPPPTSQAAGWGHPQHQTIHRKSVASSNTAPIGGPWTPPTGSPPPPQHHPRQPSYGSGGSAPGQHPGGWSPPLQQGQYIRTSPPRHGEENLGLRQGSPPVPSPPSYDREDYFRYGSQQPRPRPQAELAGENTEIYQLGSGTEVAPTDRRGWQ